MKTPLATEVDFGLGHIALDGVPAARERGTAAPLFLAHVYCGQTAGWIKMSLGTEVNVGSGDVMLDGVAAPPLKGHSPQFSVHV